MPCFASHYVNEDEKMYLTNEGVQARALKAMLERLVQEKDTGVYDYEAGNINQYGFFENLVENVWINFKFWPDESFRLFYIFCILIFGGWESVMLQVTE